ncbi:MAG TPA: DnaJ C-terminal domain-containing protein, partial [Marmoricola sp.]|nr:DnaJ C-terminal domain-containing protein [Marmoricola sp.]
PHGATDDALPSGAMPGSKPVACGTCQGRGEVQHVQRSFLGEIRTVRPCHTCRGYGEIISDPCRECSGDGRVRSRRTLSVKIPQGVDTGTRVQLTGEGEIGPGGGPAGDLYVEIGVRPHPTFTRRGNDLLCQVTLPMTAAALGTEVTLPLLEGDLEGDHQQSTTLEVRPGTQSGTQQTLRGLGVPSLRDNVRGDVVVTIVVETPSRLDARQEELLRELAALRREESPDGKVQSANKSVFDRFKDAFR